VALKDHSIRIKVIQNLKMVVKRLINFEEFIIRISIIIEIKPSYLHVTILSLKVHIVKANIKYLNRIQFMAKVINNLQV
jgi:hypothetical protein